MAIPLAPLPDKEFDAYKAAHLLWRAGFGAAWEDVDKFAALGLDGAINALVHFPSAQKSEPPAFSKLADDDSFVRAKLRSLPQAEREKKLAEKRREEREKITDLRFWWLNRMLESSPFPGAPVRSLEEKMTLFWHSHFATSFDEKVEHAYPMWQQNEMFRRNALAPFPELLAALIRDPAMLLFLDNAHSHRGRPNENFARELMELHSLGVGNYTEQDVKAAARALTGWGVNRDDWSFQKDDDAHDPDEKSYLGQAGNWDGDDVVRIITEQPACARFLTRKLLEYFVFPNPEPQLVEEIANTYRVNNFELRLFLDTLFRSRLFYSARATDSVVKSPVVLTIGALKSMRVKVPQRDVLVDALRLMGQNLFFPPDVNGWAGGMAWINSNMLLVRYNFSNYLLNGVSPDQFKVFNKKVVGSSSKRREFVENQRDSTAIAWSPREQLKQLGIDRRLVTSADIVDYYIRQFLQRPVPAEIHHQLLRFAETDASGGRRTFSLQDPNFDERVRDLAHLIMSSPDYQLC